MSYANGRYPLHLFVHRGGNIYLTPSLNARWDEAVRLGVEKYGVRLYITGDIDGLGGWNGYRPFDPQVRYRAHYGIMAAVPGTSSHGGKYQGREVFAADVANWQALAPGNPSLAWSRFVALMTIVGLTVDFVKPREQWHVGDFNPAWTVPTFGAVAVNPGTTNRPTDVHKEDEMALIRWASTGAVFVLGYEKIWYVTQPPMVGTLEKRHGPIIECSNDDLTVQLQSENIQWDAVEAVLRGEAQGTDRRFWSRLTAEGIAIRGGQAKAQLTLEQVQKTALAIKAAG